MPIYAYRCENCGHSKDVLQKISDPVLSVCPACGQASLRKQVTAAGFQLKGSGWYVTDFRGDKQAGKTAEAGANGAGEKKDGTAANGESAAADSSSSTATPAKSETVAPAVAAAPASSTPAGGKPG